MASKEPRHQLLLSFRSKLGDWLAPPELRARLLDDVKERESNMTEVITGILAAHYKVPFESSSRGTTPRDDVFKFTVHLPMPVYRALLIDKARSSAPQQSDQARVVDILCGHYGIRRVKPPPRRRKPRRPAAV